MIDWTLTKYCCVRVFRQRTSSLSKAIDMSSEKLYTLKMISPLRAMVSSTICNNKYNFSCKIVSSTALPNFELMNHDSLQTKVAINENRKILIWLYKSQ